MAITDRQKQIINPFPEDIPGAPTLEWYLNEENKFIIDAIQESYLYFYTFPSEGTVLPGKRPITPQDLQAYLALYPQNGQLSDSSPKTIVEISQHAAENNLRRFIIEPLRNKGTLENYLTKTTELTNLLDYQDNQDLANLIAIPANHSQVYKRSLRKSLDLGTVQVNDDVGLNSLMLAPNVSVYLGSDSNVDLYDWRKNCAPGSEATRVYYNPADKQYYFTKRTDHLGPTAYALNEVRSKGRTSDGVNQSQANQNQKSAWENANVNQVAKKNYTEAYGNGLKEILSLTGKYSESNMRSLRNSLKINNTEIPPRYISTYKDTRPGSRWTYALVIPAVHINRLISQEEDTISYEERELTPLQKSRILVGQERDDVPQNLATLKKHFRMIDFMRYLSSSRNYLRQVASRLFDQKITPLMLDNINLEKEIDSSYAFFDLLSLFYAYNKISPEDEDLIEFFLTPEYNMQYICINGFFYDRGTGNTTYMKPTEEVARSLDAFSLLTPTSFSFIYNIYDIFLDSVEASPENRESPLDFVQKYLYPTIDVMTVATKESELARLTPERLERKKDIFKVLTDLSKTDPNTFASMWSNKPLSYRMSSTLAGIDCDTGQMKAAKYALRFWTAAESKTKWQSLLRETIALLRNEVIDDAMTQEMLKKAGIDASQAQAGVGADLVTQAVTNPAMLRRQVQDYVDQQIACSLDVIGDFINKSYLDPVGTPPVVNDLVRETLNQTPKIEFKKNKMVSLKVRQSDIYKKAIKSILMNFIKSIVAGVAKDIITALLGCGPDGLKGENLEGSSLSDIMKKYDYGLSILTTFADEVLGIDLTNEIIEESGVVPTNDQGDLSFRVTSAQTRQLLNDVSEMCTPLELQQLLEGDASDSLIKHILEMVSSGETVTFVKTVIGSGETQEEITATIDAQIYNNLKFTKQILIDLFIALGDKIASAPAIGQLPVNSPLEAYCLSREAPVGALSLRFGDIKDLESQYFEISQDKLMKINNLCDWLRDLTNIQAELERFLDDLPLMTWYNDFLQYLADISNLFADWVAEWWAKAWDESPPEQHQAGTYNLYYTKLGVELFYQMFVTLRNVPISEIHRYPPDQHKYAILCPPNQTGRTSTIANAWERDDQEENTFGTTFQSGRHSEANLSVWRAINSHGVIGRLRLPQYLPAPQPSYETFDAAYYSLRHAPPALQKEIQKVNYPDKGVRGVVVPIGTNPRTVAERNYIKSVAVKVRDYLNSQYPTLPKTTGHTWMMYNGGPTADISCYYRTADDGGYPDRIARWNIAYEETHNETSNYQAGQNGDIPHVDYRIFNRLETSSSYSDRTIIKTQKHDGTEPVGEYGYTLYVYDGEGNSVQLPPMYNRDVTTTYAHFSIGKLTSVTSEAETRDFLPDFNLSSVNNWTQRVDQTINNAVTSEHGKKTFPRWIRALNYPVFKMITDPCVTAEDRSRAQAAVQSIQSRMQKFFINVRPLAPVYPRWGSVGTIKMISDYLAKKYEEEYRKLGIFGALLECFPYIKEVYPHLSDEGYTRNPALAPGAEPSASFRVLVESIYIAMLDNLAKEDFDQGKSMYTSANSIGFGRDDSQDVMTLRLQKTIGAFFFTMANDIQFDDNYRLRSYGVPDAKRTEVVAFLRKLYYGRSPQDLRLSPLGWLIGLYYFPVGCKIASYLIWYDYGIDFSGRYSDTAYKTQVSIASADDTMLTALKGQSITKYASKYVGFPVDVKNRLANLNVNRRGEPHTNPYYMVTRSNLDIGFNFGTQAEMLRYYSSTPVEERLAFLDTLFDSTISDLYIANTYQHKFHTAYPGVSLRDALVVIWHGLWTSRNNLPHHLYIDQHNNPIEWGFVQPRLGRPGENNPARWIENDDNWRELLLHFADQAKEMPGNNARLGSTLYPERGSDRAAQISQFFTDLANGDLPPVEEAFSGLHPRLHNILHPKYYFLAPARGKYWEARAEVRGVKLIGTYASHHSLREAVQQEKSELLKLLIVRPEEIR